MSAYSALPTGLLCALLFNAGPLHAEPVTVRYEEGSVRGYLALRSLDDKLIAAGDLTQTIHGGRLVSRLIYRFKDGSVDDDTAVFTQNGHFRLISDHRIQKGPIFSNPLDLTIKATTGEVIVRYKDKGVEKVETSHIDLPDDLANGILLDVAKNISPDTAVTTLSYVVATPKPRLIHLSFQPDGKETFRSAGRPNEALRFKVHVDIGGITGMIAPLVGKEPPDTHVWVSAGEVPAFIKSEEPLYFGGPVLRTELVSPVWPYASESPQHGQGR